MNNMDTEKIKDVFEDHGGSPGYGWVADFVYGGIDGAVTTFAVVAGVEGASLSVPVILILGFSNLFADGFSMSVSKYLSDKTHLEEYEKIEKTEYQHLKDREEHEREEVREIMETYNFKGKDLERATEIITASPKAWVNLMMRHEFNMTKENIDPIKGAMATFIAFIVVGIIPLLGYLLKPVLNLSNQETFIMASFSTLIALFIVGAVKSKFSLKHWFFSGLQTAAIGGVAAGIAYGVGFLLRGIAG